ncbi:MFS transporter [Streptomyces sp. NPDC090741]|uniref:MFS transporter n=1 Tax=Streptomyces sp. NPDC090741 TaxID=3365967 RepID=UPI003817C693
MPPLPRPDGRRLVTDSPTKFAGPGGPVPRSSLRGDWTFGIYLVGDAASLIGTSVHAVALPVLAVLHLQATPAQVAHLYLLIQAPNFVMALPAGALADRYAPKTLLIATDLAAAGLVAAVPAAALAGTLSMPLLYVVAVFLGAVTVLHHAAASAILPKLVAPALLHQAISRQEAILGAASTAGTYLGTAVVALTGAAWAFALDSISYLVSAWCTSRIPGHPSPSARERPTRLTTEVWEGILYVARDPLLRPLALCMAGTGVGAGVIAVFSGWYLLTVLQTGPTGLGLIMGMSGAGYLVGALVSPRLVGRFGPGTVLIASVAVYPLMEVPLLLADPGPLWLVILSLAGALQLAAAACATATVRTVRQQMCPPSFQARVQQTSVWFVGGSRPLAALAAGALAAAVGVWATLLTGALVLVATALALWASPVRHRADMPTAVGRGQ